ncbi:MAG: DUF4375 domain-containing protein [Imperialibacter sp.]
MLSNDSNNRKDHNKFSGYDEGNQLRPKISKASFFQTTGYDFCWLLLEPLDIAGSDEDEVKLAKRFSPGQKALYFWWFLDAQVTNGGFVQFYFNGYDIYVPAIIEGLTHIGDGDMTELVVAAHKIYKENKTVIDSARRSGELYDGNLVEKLEDLASLDRRYYELNSNTLAIIEKYANENPSEFCVDESGEVIEKNASGKFTTTFSDGVIKEEFNLINGVLDGQFKAYYPTGKIKSLRTYVQGEQFGEQKSWYENRNLSVATLIDSVSKAKRLEFFYENKQRSKLEHTDKNGDRIGDYEEWYQNGQLKEKATFVSKNERVGDWTTFWENGGKRLEAEGRDGKIYFRNYWNEDAEQLLRDGTGLYIAEFDYGGLSKLVYRYEKEFKGYKKDGVSKTYVNGIIRSSEEFKEDVLHGLTQNFDDEGELQDEKIFERGKLISSKEVKK